MSLTPAPAQEMRPQLVTAAAGAGPEPVRSQVANRFAGYQEAEAGQGDRAKEEGHPH